MSTATIFLIIAMICIIIFIIIAFGVCIDAPIICKIPAILLLSAIPLLMIEIAVLKGI
jgi:hypothetical protein